MFVFFQTSDADESSVPMPIVLIDQDSDPSATMVQLSFGDRLGALIDTVMHSPFNNIPFIMKLFFPFFQNRLFLLSKKPLRKFSFSE